VRYRFLLQHGNQLGNQGVAIADSCDIRLEAFVCRQIWSANDMAHLRELPVIADSQDELAVGGIECLIGHDARMTASHPWWNRAGDQIVHVYVRDRRHLDVK
jgi:hypothetical protein